MPLHPARDGQILTSDPARFGRRPGRPRQEQCLAVDRWPLWRLTFHFGPVTVESPAACSPSVSTMPGFTEFTRILRGPSSFATETWSRHRPPPWSHCKPPHWESASPRPNWRIHTALGTKVLNGFRVVVIKTENIQIELLVKVFGSDITQGTKLRKFLRCSPGCRSSKRLRFGKQPLNVSLLGNIGLHGHRPAPLLRSPAITLSAPCLLEGNSQTAAPSAARCTG